MSKLLLSSDQHLGHKNITKYRTQFSSAEEHHNFVFENLATNVGKRDTLYLLGDVAFDKYWLDKIKSIRCHHKKLILGNHCSEHHSIKALADAFDSIDSLLSKRNVWFSHCPIHPQEMRNRLFNVHGHLHNQIIPDDKRYINVCLEHTNYKPISFADIMEMVNDTI